MSEAADDLAAQIVAEALRQAGHGPSACAALMREAGEALARLVSHDRACRVHAELARRHAQRAARCWRP
jgi:TolA-binding protein